MLSLKHSSFCHVLVLISFILILIAINIEMTLRLISVDFKVFGRVQGVFFRKFTKKKAEELELRGWVQNDIDGTVIGVIQGIEEHINSMKHWLSSKGSPYSQINRCDFTNEREINEYQFNGFKIRH